MGRFIAEFRREEAQTGPRARASLMENAGLALFLALLAWAPFPLGSNRPWSWSLLCLAIALCWALWTLSAWRDPGAPILKGRPLLVPALLALAALIWAFLQAQPFVPLDWINPVWRTAGSLLGVEIRGAISLLPWRTVTELMKLGAYAMAFWLAFSIAQNDKRARLLLDGSILFGALYAAYAFVLVLAGQSQFELFYGVRATTVVRDLSGPFVNHNNFATFAGLTFICAGARLVEGGWAKFTNAEGLRRAAAALHYLFGRGAIWLAATVLALSAVIATGSRAGNFATFSALALLVALSLKATARRPERPTAMAVALAGLVAVAVLFAINGGTLLARFDDLAPGQNLRLVLWQAAVRMIREAPFLGLGLGTYQTAYPLYAHVTTPFIIDKAHNDYLELAAGWGVPAALLWWSALLWLAGLCVRGAFIRRRTRIYPMLGAGAALLVGIHSLFDFSLQMPAIAFTFATILGLGVAQAFPTRNRSQEAAPTPLPGWMLWPVRILLAVPILLIVVAARPRLLSGLAQEAAFPETAYMTEDASLSRAAYENIAASLSRAPKGDGKTGLTEAEARTDAGAPPATVIAQVKADLARAPADARGWILLAALLSSSNPKAAAAALAFAFTLAPHQYYLILPRSVVAVSLWPQLAVSAQTVLLQDVRGLALDPDRLAELRVLLSRPGGAALVTRALKGRPDEIRDLNRELTRDMLQGR